jgi:mRNA-degrading endonuclease RelE of RelBE toxin-antitoxin system
MPLGMLAQPESSLRPFTVEISPTAWKQIAHLSQDMYRVLRERLRTLADLASVGCHPVHISTGKARVQATMSFMVGDFAALYEADPHSRIIRLLEVARRLPTSARKARREFAGHA